MTSYTNDIYGMLLQIADLSGAADTYPHDQYGQIQRIADAVGAAGTFPGDKYTQLKRIADVVGAADTYPHDQYGQILRIADGLHGAGGGGYSSDIYGQLERIALLGGVPTYYVALPGNGGSDSNPGTKDSPWATIGKVTSQTFIAIARTTVLFNGGDTFSGSLAFTTSNAPGSIAVGSYGAGVATINSGNSAEGFKATNLGGVKVTNLNFTGGGALTNTTKGILFINDQAGNIFLAGPIIDNCSVSGYGSSAIKINGASAGYSGFNGTVITNNLLDNCTQNDTTDGDGTGGIIFASDSSYGTGTITPAHTNMYIGGNTITNMHGTAGSTNWSGSGIVLKQSAGGIVERNYIDTFAKNNTHCGGSCGIMTIDGTRHLLQLNEVCNGSYGSGACDSNGFDIALGCTYVIGQFNYAHDNGDFNFHVDNEGGTYPWGNNAYYFNISQGAKYVGEFGISFFVPTTGPLYVCRNIFVNSKLPAVAIGLGASSSFDAIFGNNSFISGGGANIIQLAVPSNAKFYGNNYWAPFGAARNFSWNGTSYTTFAAWQTATQQEILNSVNVGSTVNPEIYVPGGGFVNGGYVPSKLMAYNLQTGSPMLSAGVDLTQLGIALPPTDYFGMPVAENSKVVGAAEGDFAVFSPSSTAVANFLARVSGFSKLDNVNYNSVLCGLSSDNILSQLDLLYFPAAPNSAAALLNTLSASFTLTNHGAAFTARHGYTGDGTSAFLDTNYTPSTQATNYALTSVTLAAYALTNGLTNQSALIGAQNAAGTAELSIFVPAASATTSFYADANAEGGATMPALGSTQGMFGFDKAGAVNNLYWNGAFIHGPVTNASVAFPDHSVYLLAYNQPGATYWSSNTIAAMALGAGGLNQTKLSERINSFMTAYGINTY